MKITGLLNVDCYKSEQIEYTPCVHGRAAVRRELSNEKNTTKILPCKRSDRTREKPNAVRTHSANDQLDRAVYIYLRTMPTIITICNLRRRRYNNCIISRAVCRCRFIPLENEN